MLRLDRERPEQRARSVRLESPDTDEFPSLGGNDERIEHGDVEVFHGQLGRGQQPGDGIELLSPRTSQLRGGHRAPP